MNTPSSLAPLVFALLLTALCPQATAEEELGRLFFTPERRQALDRQRQFNLQEKQEIPEDPMFTIDGVVSRSSGKRTVWINGLPQSGNDGEPRVITNPKEPGNVLLQGNESTSNRAKVGDTVNRNTGESASLLGNGRIVIKREH